MIDKSKQEVQVISAVTMADVIFLLLIFFMVTTKIKENYSNPDAVATADVEKTADGSDGVMSQWSIKIAGDANAVHYIFEDEKMSFENIKDRIIKSIPAPTEIGIDGSDNVPYGKVKEFIIFCWGLNIKVYKEIKIG